MTSTGRMCGKLRLQCGSTGSESYDDGEFDDDWDSPSRKERGW